MAMFVLEFLTLASALRCCIGYTVVQRPAEYYNYWNNYQNYQLQPSDYQWKSTEYQWQPLDYAEQPYDYQYNNYQYNNYQPNTYQPNSYPTNYYQPYYYKPYDYQPYNYKPYEYQPSYSSYYYYPQYDLSTPYGYNVRPKLPHAAAQQLLQVYRMIRVLDVFRDSVPDPAPTSLDQLIQELSDEALQYKLAELLHNEPGYEEVAGLVNDPNVNVMNPFVNNHRRLLPAIQRAITGVDLTTELDHDLYGRLRALRDQANALTVEQIEAELSHGLRGQAKEVEVSDVLENLLDDVEAKDLEEFHENLQKEGDLNEMDKYLVVIDDPEIKIQQEPKQSNDFHDETLDDLEAALEVYLEEQKLVEANKIKEKSITEHEQETTVASTTTETPIPVEAPKDSWLGSLLGKGHLLPGHYGSSNEAPESQKLPQPIDVSQPAVLVEMDEMESNKLDDQNAWVHQKKEDTDPLDFDIDQRFQAPSVTSTEKTNSVTHSVPLWLIENSKKQDAESKQIELIDLFEDHTEGEEELLRQLPDEQDEEDTNDTVIELEDIMESRTEGDDEIVQELPGNEQVKTEKIPSMVGEEKAREAPSVEEKRKEDGPARYDLLVELEHQYLLGLLENSTEDSVTVDTNQELERLDVTTETSSTEATSVGQPSAANVYEVHTESTRVEARGESSTFTPTAPSESDVRSYVREELLKVLNLLVESNGFPELKEDITEGDLKELVEELSLVQMGVRWTEMISALQKLIANKKLHNSDRIVETLEHWKQGGEGNLDDGYFDRTYGNEEQVESRQIDEIDMEEMQFAQFQAAIVESRNLEEEVITTQGPFVDKSDNYFDGAYNLTNKTVNQSLPLNGSANQNETTIPTDETRNARFFNVGSNQNELDNSTQDPPVTEDTSIRHSLQTEETTDKLEVTTLQSFPTNET